MYIAIDLSLLGVATVKADETSPDEQYGAETYIGYLRARNTPYVIEYNIRSFASVSLNSCVTFLTCKCVPTTVLLCNSDRCTHVYI